MGSGFKAAKFLPNQIILKVIAAGKKKAQWRKHLPYRKILLQLFREHNCSLSLSTFSSSFENFHHNHIIFQ